MSINDIFPIVIPGVIMQLSIQAYYINHCWQNKRLTQKQKALYIIAIAIFNIPAAAIYLFSTRKRTADQIQNTSDKNIDGNIKQGILALLIISFEISTFNMIAKNMLSKDYVVIIWLLATGFILMLIDGLLINKRHRLLYYLIPAVEIVLVLLLYYLDNSASSQFIVLAVVASIINSHSLKHAKIYSIIAFCLYFAIIILKPLAQYGALGDDELIYVYMNALIFILVFTAFYTMKKQLLVNDQLETALKELKEKSLKLEEMSTVAERNRITGEIHDTVGHTLTTAIISIQAGQKLLCSDADTAKEIFHLAEQQIQRGLQDIRYSVKTIKEGDNKAFVPELQAMLNDIRKNTGLTVTDIVKIETNLLPIQQKVLCRAIKECTTNSLKHGNSTEVDILLQEYKNNVQLTFSDNGTGTENIVFGFGLKGMAELVQSIGGTLSTNSEKGEGFTVSISIPTGFKAGGE